MAINKAACVSKLRWREVQKNRIRPTNKDCEAYKTELRKHFHRIIACKTKVENVI